MYSSWKLINTAHGKPVEETSTGFESSTIKFHSTRLSSPNLKFELVDSPGFDNALISDSEIFSKLVDYLLVGSSGPISHQYLCVGLLQVQYKTPFEVGWRHLHSSRR